MVLIQINHILVMSQFYEDICNMFIRPTRQTYNYYDLGSPIINKNGRRKDFEIQSHHRFKIKCSFYENTNLVSSNRNKTCVIYLHSFNGSRLQSIRFCRKLIENDYHACSFDFSGSGNSEGEYVTLGHQEKYDIWEVVKYLNTNFNIEYIVLWGRSMGASSIITFYNYFEQMKKKPINSASLIQQKFFPNIYNIKILSIVLDSPFCSLSRLAIQIAKKKFIVPQIIVKVLLSMVNKTMETKANLSIDELQLINKLQVITCPVLLLASQEDTLIDYKHSEQIFKKLISQEKQLYFIKGDHHEFRSEQTIKNIIYFIEKHRKQQKISIKQVMQSKQLNDLSLSDKNRHKAGSSMPNYIPRKLSSKSHSKNKTDRLKIIGNSLQSFHNMEKHINQRLRQSKQLNSIQQQKPKQKTLIKNTVEFFPSTESNQKHMRQSSDGVSKPVQVNYKKNTQDISSNYNSTPYDSYKVQHNQQNSTITQNQNKKENHVYATPPTFRISFLSQKQKNQEKISSKLQSLKMRSKQSQNIEEDQHNVPHSQRFVGGNQYIIPKTDTARYRISANSHQDFKNKVVENKNRLTSKNKLPNVYDNIIQQTPTNKQLCISKVNQYVLQKQKESQLLNHENYNIIQDKLKKKKKGRLTFCDSQVQGAKIQENVPLSNIIFKNYQVRHQYKISFEPQQNFKLDHENQAKRREIVHRQPLYAYPQPLSINTQQHIGVINKGQQKIFSSTFLGTQHQTTNKKQIIFKNIYPIPAKKMQKEFKQQFLFKSTAISYNNLNLYQIDQEIYPQIRRLNTQTIIEQEQEKNLLHNDMFTSMKCLKNKSRQLQSSPKNLGQKSNREQAKIIQSEKKCIFLKSPHKKQNT